MNQENVKKITVGNGAKARKIALLQQSGTKGTTGLFWLNGYKSSMLGQKARAVADWAAGSGVSCTRMDYSGHGQSEGHFEDGTISRWLEEALVIFEERTSGPQIIIGSSMGGWLALLLALTVKPLKKVKGIILIAPAWDMTEKLMWAHFPDEIKAQIEREGFYARPSAYGDGDYVITKKLIEDGRNHLIQDKKLHFGCPIHIVHGRQDPDVAWSHGQALMALLPLDDVRFSLIHDGDHRLSRTEDIGVLIRLIEEMMRC